MHSVGSVTPTRQQQQPPQDCGDAGLAEDTKAASPCGGEMDPSSGGSSGNGSRSSLVFSVRGPIPIQLDENMPSWSSGASVLDLIFPHPETVSEIRFRNWYTARLSLLVRFDDSTQSPPKREHLAWAAAASLSLARLRGVDTTEGISIGRHLTTTSRSPSDWVVSIQNKDLMSDPHCETGSQDVVAISAANESLITLHEVTALRFLLRQPSPNWKSFSINDITVYRDSLMNAAATKPLQVQTDRHGSGYSTTTNGYLKFSSSTGPGFSSGRGRFDSRPPGAEDDGASGAKDQNDEMAQLNALVRQTQAAVLKQKNGAGTDKRLPSSYDVATLQLNS